MLSQAFTACLPFSQAYPFPVCNTVEKHTREKEMHPLPCRMHSPALFHTSSMWENWGDTMLSIYMFVFSHAHSNSPFQEDFIKDCIIFTACVVHVLILHKGRWGSDRHNYKCFQRRTTPSFRDSVSVLSHMYIFVMEKVFSFSVLYNILQ